MTFSPAADRYQEFGDLLPTCLALTFTHHRTS